MGFDVLEGFISPKEGRFYSVLDARGEMVYCLLQERRKGQIFRLGEPVLMNLEQFYQVIEEVDHIVGPSFQKIISEKALEIAPEPRAFIFFNSSRMLDPSFCVKKSLDVRYHRAPL